MKPLSKILICLLLVVGLVSGFLVWRNRSERLSILVSSVPARPDLSGFLPEFSERVEACEKKIRGGAVASLDELSRLYHSNGYYPEACQCYLGLMQVDPSNPAWPHRLASILAGYGQLEESIPLWRMAADLAPDYVQARIRLGDALFKTDHLEEAAKAYSAALKLQPTNAYALLGIARIDIEANRWQNARINLEAAARQTNYSVGYDLLATAYEQLGSNEKAWVLRASQKASGAYFDIPDPRVDEIFFDCYDPFYLDLASGSASRGGDQATALRLAQRALTIAPNNLLVHFKVAGFALQAGDKREAAAHYKKCTEVDPTFADGWWQLSDLLGKMGDKYGSEQVLRKGLEACPQSPGLHLEHGKRLMAAGLLDEAEVELKESVRIRPDEAPAYIDLFRLYCLRDRASEGMVFLKRALLSEPAHPLLLTTMMFYSITEGDAAEARRWYAKVRLQPRVGQEAIQKLEQSYAERFGSQL